MCKFCNSRVEWTRRDSCEKHIHSKNHVALKTKAQTQPVTVQTSITDSVRGQIKATEQKTQFIIDTTTMFLKANVPIEKMDHPAVRSWLQQYVKGAGDLPTAQHIRREYVPKIGKIVAEEIKEKLKGKPVVIFCDETTDRMGNCVFAVLFGTLEGSVVQKLYLGSCTYLDAANSTNCVRAILNTVRDMDIKYDNVYGVCSDSAPYMILCAQTLKTIFGEQFAGFTCWCHKFNLIGEVWQANLKELNSVVGKVKGLFRNSRKLKGQYKAHLEEKYPELASKLFPIPVLTRWSSWFKSVQYLSEYFPAILSFLERYKGNLSPQGQHLHEKLTPSFYQIVLVQAVFIKENSLFISGPIEQFQTKSEPVAHLLFGRLESLLGKCDLVSKGQCGSRVNELLDELSPVLKASVLSSLRLCGTKAHTKLSKYMDTSAANKLFEEVRIVKALSWLFDPAKVISRGVLNFEIAKENFKMLPLFTTFEGDIVTCYNEAVKMIKTEGAECLVAGKSVKIASIMSGMATNDFYRDFSKRCLQSMWLPVSNADAERYFSRYSLVVTDCRTTMKCSNIVTSCMLQFGDTD